MVQAFFFIRTNKFCPRFVVLKFLHNLSLNCFYIVLVPSYKLSPQILSINMSKDTCGAVLIFFPDHSVFLTAERPTLQCNVTCDNVMCCVFQ